MTFHACQGPDQDVDFFSLHNRKKKEINVDMLDYGFVERCNDLDELKGILALLRSGKEGRYPHLETFTEDRILALLPEKERLKIQRMRATPSQEELSSEKAKLSDWAAEIDGKHRSLQELKRSSKRLPPVRGQAPNVETASTKPLITEVTQKERKKAIPAYDFRAWEKFDVDAAIADIEREDQMTQEEARRQREAKEKRDRERQKELASLPSYVVLDELTAAEREVYALHEKQKGNESFKANENEEAVLYYTRSMAFDDTNAVIYANRAMAHLRLKNFAQAEDDCTRAVLLDPTYFKAWTRRGMTRFRRGKYAEAIEDFEHALMIEPGNKEVEKLLKKTMDKWKEIDGRVEGNQATNDDCPDTMRQATQERPAEEKPFKRFEIIEEDDEDDDANDPNAVEQGAPFQRFEILEE
ncbi:hypothetical protein P43SY_007854 [Pythium insidiosum]|uniref:Uncharacterized protein n=1 Tax=Pythium insidiosum TaxID=114742 RepID=A0AAD5M337_PYTIN|nr:hypothetical protein P43SY_007854 [Pythium insidiosum]